MFILFCSSLTYAKDSFILGSLSEAKTLAKSTNKPLLIIFGADYCRYCNDLKQDILSYELSPEVNPYIICYLDISQDTELKTKYNISVLPDSRIFVKDQQKSKNTGYSIKQYKTWLNNAK
jgi:thioredoxin-related protein